MLAGNGNASGMNLSETRITKEGAPFVGAISSGDIATARVGRKKENVAVTAGREDNGVAGDRIDLARAKISGDDPLGVTIDQNEIKHFRLWKHFDSAERDLTA